MVDIVFMDEIVIRNRQAAPFFSFLKKRSEEKGVSNSHFGFVTSQFEGNIKK